MIHKKCFSIDWIRGENAAIGCRNPIQLEKAILALELVGRLSEAGLRFQFKGGTSLLLRLPELRRLSIDVDIVCLDPQERLEAILADVAMSAPFAGFDHQAKRDRALPPKCHYGLHFTSATQNRAEQILLDVLLETEAGVPDELATVSASFIEVEHEVQVRVPLVEGLLGDKLTAFAPTTVGILYHPDRTLDIVKQLHDVAALFDVANDLALVNAAFERTLAAQNRYRSTSWTKAQVLDDSVDAAYLLAQKGLRGTKETAHSQALFAGLQALDSHILKTSFRIDQARLASGKVALLSALLRQPSMNDSLGQYRYRPDLIPEFAAATISNPWAPLQRIRGGNPEAFFYWWKAQQVGR